MAHFQEVLIRGMEVVVHTSTAFASHKTTKNVLWLGQGSKPDTNETAARLYLSNVSQSRACVCAQHLHRPGGTGTVVHVNTAHTSARKQPASATNSQTQITTHAHAHTRSCSVCCYAVGALQKKRKTSTGKEKGLWLDDMAEVLLVQYPWSCQQAPLVVGR